MIFETLIFQISALCLDFEGAKNIHILLVPIWGFGGLWRFLSRVWHVDLVLIWSLVFDVPMIQIFALYLDFNTAKKIHVL